MRINLKYRSLICLTIASMAAVLRAEDAAVTRWYEGQYVIGVNSIPALRAKAEKAVDDATPEDLDVLDQTSKILVMGPADQVDSPEAIVVDELEPSDDLCKKLRQQHRLDIRAFREGEGSSINRAISCSPNIEVQANALPNDPKFADLWGMHQDNNIDIDAPEAWNITTGSDSTVVAVIDTGVDYNHPDLVANMWVNPGEIPGNGRDDDSNGYVDDVHGINAITNSGNPMDDNGHGTHCSGTIAGRGNNSVGVAGVNWNAKIMGCKFLSSSGGGSLANAVKCIDYVTMMRSRGVSVKLSSNSWGYSSYAGYNPIYPELQDAITRAQNADILFVAAAGNDGGNCNSNSLIGYPARYPNDNIVGVAAIASSGSLAYFSNRGDSCADIAAPGYGIVSTWPNNQYASLSGTSMATPHVAGALALLASYAPSLNWSALRNNLLTNARSLQSLNGLVGNNSLLNVNLMLLNAVHDPSATPPPTATPQPTSTPTPVPTATSTPTATPTPQPGYWNLSGVASISAGAVPKEGVRVKLTTSNGEYVAYSDAHGRYIFSSILGPTNYTVSAESAGHRWDAQTGYLSNHSTLNLTGHSLNYNVSLLVLDQDLKPLSDVSVSITPGFSGATNNDGLISVSAPYGSSYMIYLSKNGYKFKSDTLVGNVYGDVRRKAVAVTLQ